MWYVVMETIDALHGGEGLGDFLKTGQSLFHLFSSSTSTPKLEEGEEIKNIIKPLPLLWKRQIR